MRYWAAPQLLLAILVVACSQAQPAAVTTAVSSSTQNSVICQLPISVNRADGTGSHGAFVDFPSGQVTFDPTGGGGVYYDRRFSKWLPTTAAGVSPDGSHYAIGGGTSDGKPILRIVDVATGAEDVYPLPSEISIGLSGPMVIGYAIDAVYIGEPLEGYMAALWTFDIATHQTSFMNVTGIGAIDGKTVWRTTVDLTDKAAWSWPGTGPANQIERYDLGTGGHTVWLNSPGHFVGVIGVDADHHPIILDSADKQNTELAVLVGVNDLQTIVKSSQGDWTGFIVGVSADSHGIWFGTGMGIYLASAVGLMKVTDQAGVPAGTCA